MQKTQYQGIIVSFKLSSLHCVLCLTNINIQGKKIKSVRRDNFGSKLGRLHMTKQDVNSLQTRKMKGLKKTFAEKKMKRKSDAESGQVVKKPKVATQSKKLKKFSKKGRKLRGGQV